MMRKNTLLQLIGMTGLTLLLFSPCSFMFGQSSEGEQTGAAGTSSAKPAPSAFDVFRYAMRNAEQKEGKRLGEAEVKPPEYFGLSIYTGGEEANLLEKFLPKVIIQNTDGTRFQRHVDVITALHLCRDGKTMITGSADKTAMHWDINSQKSVKIFQDEFNHKLGITDVVASPDETHVLTASYDNSIRLWNIKTGKNTKSFLGLKDRVWSIAVAPNGLFVAGSSDEGTIMIWDPSTMKVMATLTGSAGAVYDLNFSNDGQYLLSCGADMITRIWALEWNENKFTCKQVQAFTGHTGAVYSAIFSPDENYVLTASHDKTARIWNTNTAEELCRFVGHVGAVRKALFIAPTPPVTRTGAAGQAGIAQSQQQTASSSNAFVATASDDGTVRIWLPNLQKPKTARNTGASSDSSANDMGYETNMGGGDPSEMGMQMGGRTGRRVFTTITDREFEEEARARATAAMTDDDPEKKKTPVKSANRPASKNKGIELCNICIPSKVAIYDLVATPDSNRLIGGCADGIVRIWNVPDVTAELRKMNLSKNMMGMGSSGDNMMGGDMMQ